VRALNEIHERLPRARRSQLVSREVAGELLVYDRNSNQAHCLNSTAAMVWARCDGTTTISEMAQLLEAEMNVPVADQIVWLALEQLRESHLLQGPPAKSARLERMPRRVMMKRLGVTAAVTLPLVSSIVAPTAAAAATCRPNGSPCAVDSQCCSNNCANNGRGGLDCS
jgi:hypothetical protein